jgi:hypothetical protein
MKIMYTIPKVYGIEILIKLLRCILSAKIKDEFMDENTRED